jgi:flavin reductase (DIM6/NTAB) family NADH-FMN oxidoreductase RutF
MAQEGKAMHQTRDRHLRPDASSETDVMGAGVLEAPGFTPRKYRDTMARFASGITVVSGWHEDTPIGFTCQSFHSVSLDPPLVSISVMTSSTTYPRIRESGAFAVNVLADGQQSVSDRFARSGTDKWSGVSWSPSPRGLPVIDGVLVWLDCEIREEHPAGDHIIVVGEVLTFGTPEVDELDPLIFYDKNYRRLGAHASQLQ